MEDCHTPTYTQMLEFKFDRTPTMVFSSTSIQDAQNLFANCTNLRCYTPTTDNFQSPGLSPISEIAKNFLNTVVETGFANRLDAVDPKNRYRSTPTNAPFTKAAKTPQTTVAHIDPTKSTATSAAPPPLSKAHFISDSPPIMPQNSTTLEEGEFSLEVTSPNESTISSRITSFLEHTMSVQTLLRSVGLEQYTELFAKQQITFQDFVNMSGKELQRSGVRKAEHRQIIMELLNELKGSDCEGAGERD